jgi:hypothetical protein
MVVAENSRGRDSLQDDDFIGRPRNLPHAELAMGIVGRLSHVKKLALECQMQDRVVTAKKWYACVDRSYIYFGCSLCVLDVFIWPLCTSFYVGCGFAQVIEYAGYAGRAGCIGLLKWLERLVDGSWLIWERLSPHGSDSAFVYLTKAHLRPLTKFKKWTWALRGWRTCSINPSRTRRLCVLDAHHNLKEWINIALSQLL